MNSADKHHELDELGQGLCSVPMWMGGSPAGFCDKPAFGKQPPCRMVWSHAQQTTVRDDGRYSGYVPGLACHMHGGPEFRTFMDGNAWCAVRSDFENLQESNAGFGDTKEQAVAQLRAARNAVTQERVL